MQPKKKINGKKTTLKINGSFEDVIRKAVEGNPKPIKKPKRKS